MEVARGKFAKLDDDKRLAFGWASVVSEDGQEIVDHQGDVLDVESMENAVYEYVLDSRDADEMHERAGVGRLVESCFVTQEKMFAMGMTGDRQGWWVGFRVDDDEVWQKVKNGTYPMFSIVGVGHREEITEVPDAA